MKFLADENFPRAAVEALRKNGFDVTWVVEDQPGLPDERVLESCFREARTLLTFDKDFGELAFKKALPAACGIVLFRLAAESPEEIARIVLSALRSQSDWANRFTVVTRNRIRITPIRPQKS